MIIYDLRCDQGHVFEGWFQDRRSFEEQRERGFITCPFCGSTKAEIAPSSVNFLSRESKEGTRGPIDRQPMLTLKVLHDFLVKNFEDVGERFADVALKIHYGEEERRNIRGTTTPEEEENLREEGVPFVKVPLPKFDA
ncbi:MAG TPA: DUF1178 family protein [Syntrophales bacterium]|nr:DUF1178 family protein [Syntrophales bacterium]HOM06752.1 DUF1178 family protein [Syntrophales bacterium]HOO00074.1 DUF1178 family protein [Syntrophales bacterium]HPC01661.1 DUF1178 family protein [Syntrophales bacterium]HPQ06090.1 DUF1178 family protein [Syntrophales bacterium]